MFVFDVILLPVDNFWKRRFRESEKARRSAEANSRYYKDTASALTEERDKLSERDIGQYHAIELMNRKIEALEREIEALQRLQQAKDKEIGLLHEALKSERNLNTALKTNGMLWENLKGEKITKGEAL